MVIFLTKYSKQPGLLRCGTQQSVNWLYVIPDLHWRKAIMPGLYLIVVDSSLNNPSFLL